MMELRLLYRKLLYFYYFRIEKGCGHAFMNQDNPNFNKEGYERVIE